VTTVHRDWNGNPDCRAAFVVALFTPRRLGQPAHGGADAGCLLPPRSDAGHGRTEAKVADATPNAAQMGSFRGRFALLRIQQSKARE
jgi:hypothetical protein